MTPSSLPNQSGKARGHVSIFNIRPALKAIRGAERWGRISEAAVFVGQLAVRARGHVSIFNTRPALKPIRGAERWGRISEAAVFVGQLEICRWRVMHRIDDLKFLAEVTEP
jgi:hypothetical protein